MLEVDRVVKDSFKLWFGKSIIDGPLPIPSTLTFIALCFVSPVTR